MGIIASFQLFGPPDWPAQSTFQTYISNTHPDWCLRWNDFIRAEPQGLRVTGSTDAPFNDAPCDYSPFRVVYQAVTRQGYLNRSHAGWELAQTLTVEDCLKLLTIDGAYATFEEDKKGSLAPGKWADLVVVSENPLGTQAPEDLLDTQIRLTMVGGRVEFRSADGTGGFNAPVETFRENSTFISASKYLAGQTPNLAFDGRTDTNWGAGDSAPQWIQIDLSEEISVTGIDLVIDQWPAGYTIHQIWAKTNDPSAVFVLLHEFKGNTTMDQVLSYTSPSDMDAYRYFKILTTRSPSWVSWKEIRIHRQDPAFVDGNDAMFPQTDALVQNYPNPFNPSTTIGFELRRKSHVLIRVTTVRGDEMATLMNGTMEAGAHRVVFNARGLPSGIYVCTLRVNEIEKSVKMLFVK